MTTIEPDYKRRDSPNDPKYSDRSKYNPELNGVANKQNYTFNYGMNTQGRDYNTYYTEKTCYDDSDLSETDILIEILNISKREADDDFKTQINNIIGTNSPVVATEKLKYVKYDITKFLTKNLTEYYGYNILAVCEEKIKSSMAAANGNYKTAVANRTITENNKTAIEKNINDTAGKISAIRDEINKTMGRRKNIIINGNARATTLIKSNFDVKNSAAYAHELSETEYDAKLKTRVAELAASILAISKEINEDITYNDELLKSREADAAVLHTTKKKEIGDLNTKLYVDRYNTVKAENDKFKKTWDGIVNTDFMNDLKGKYNKQGTTYIEIINTILFYTYYFVVVGLAYYLFAYSVSSVIFSAVFIAFFVVFPFFIHSIEIIVYKSAMFLSALIYGTVYGDGGDGDKMDEFKTPMVYSFLKPPQPT